jgi:hypothetical protein
VKLFLTCLLSVLLLCSKAQVSYHVLQNIDTAGVSCNGLISIQAHAEVGSNFLHQKLIEPFVIGGSVTYSDRYRALNAMDELGLFGGEAYGNIRYFGGKDSLFNIKKLGLMIQTGTRYWMSGTVGREAFQLLALGNSELVGDTVPLNTIQGEALGYQFVGGGIFDKRTFSFFSVSLVNGLFHNQIQMGYPSYFYTSPNADTLELSYVGQFWQTQQNRKTSNGIGVVFDGEYNYCGSPGIVGKEIWSSIGIRNIGWVKWNSLSSQTYFDSTYVWTGLDLNEALDGDGTLNANFIQDSLASSKSNLSYWRPTRGAIYVRSIYSFLPQWKLRMQMEFYPAPVNPLLLAGFIWTPNEFMQISSEYARGGFTKSKWGIGCSFKIKNAFFVGVQTSHLLGFVSENSKSMSGSIQLNYMFNQKK